MIYTVTVNPAIDYVVHTSSLKPGEFNRSEGEQMYFGGKGINVSIVLRELGIDSVALGFTAGFTGEAIENGLAKMGIKTDFVRLRSGNSRINVKIKAEEETELNGQGPDISEGALDELFAGLDKLSDGDTLILAGSIPSSLPSDIYEKILHHLSAKNIRTVVDATKQLLLNTLKYRPYLIKPNNFELGELFGVTLENDEEIMHYAMELQKLGARNILVSMAENGAILLDENGNFHSCGVCKGSVKNSVGAGDSMLAGFIAGIEKGDADYALRLGTAAGGATTFSEGLASGEYILELMKQL